jgi:hypothetical protein
MLLPGPCLPWLKTTSPWLPSFVLALIYMPICLLAFYFHHISIYANYMWCCDGWLDGVVGWRDRSVESRVGGGDMRSSGDIPCLWPFSLVISARVRGLPWRGALGARSTPDLVLMEICWIWLIWDRTCGDGHPWVVSHMLEEGACFGQLRVGLYGVPWRYIERNFYINVR